MWSIFHHLRFALFASAIEFVTANDQCRTEVNIQGMALKRSVFKRWSVAAPYLCDVKCGQEITCQSYNYNRKYQICELNNRTKEARPENFVSAPGWFYIRRLNGRGSISELPALSCQEIKASEAPLSFTPDGRKGRLGIIQKFTVPRTAKYLIKAFGARGGTHSYNYGYRPGTYYGGYGAAIEGTFRLTKGTVLNIVVGQRGGDSVEVKDGQSTTMTAAQLGLSVEDNAGTGGGGGSFAYTTNDLLLLAAGGAGGASSGYNGVDGQAGTSGTSSVGKDPSNVKRGGTKGQPGECNNDGASYHGGAGAGWNGQSCSRKGPEHGEGGGSRAQGWIGGQAGGMNSGNNGGPAPGAVGGFGGGGGGAEDNGASGGGGGYSGGGSGTKSNQAGGGGGSYCAGENCHGVTGGNVEEDGLMQIIEQ